MTRARLIDSEGLRLLQSPAFVREHVAPLCPGECTPRVAQATMSRRATVAYLSEERPAVFGKWFEDAAAGERAFEALRFLHGHGFDQGSRYQVPAPLAWLPREKVLLMGALPGTSVHALLREGAQPWEHGLREAAAWIATLHRLDHPLPERPYADDESLRLARRCIKATMRHPTFAPVLREALRDIEKRRPLLHGAPVTWSHGRYNAHHVIVAEGATGAIDIDGCRPAHAAKDLAEFVDRLRKKVYLAGMPEDVADRGTRIFLAAYLKENPIDVSAMAYYWPLHALDTLADAICQRHVPEDVWGTRIASYTRELHERAMHPSALLDDVRRIAA